jgi:hypothetical protein
MIVETISAIKTRLTNTLQANTALYDPLNADPTKRGLTSPSQVAAWNNFLGVIATEINTLQALMNIFELEVEGFISLAPPDIALWIQNKVFSLQYSAANPQVLQLDPVSFIAVYPVIDKTLLLITRCSVTTAPNRTVNIKVAKQNPPVPIVGAEITALAAALDIWLPAGVKAKIISLNPDRAEVDAQVFYNGQYSAVIQANVIAAINNYFATLPFNGTVLISAIEDAIQAVAGVTDVVISKVIARPASLAYGLGTILTRNWPTVAGYIISEDTATHTLTDTLIFTAG